MSSLYRDANLTDKRLRRKDDTAVDDADSYTTQVDPGAIYITTGGVADAGDLTITITPVDARNPTPDPIVATITTETLAESAEALYDAVVADLAATADPDVRNRLSAYIARAEYTAATQVARLIPQPGAHKFTVTVTGTGGTMTLTLSPDDVFPITAWSAKQVGANVGAPGEVALTVNAVTSADEILAIGTCTFDMQVLRVIERYDPVNQIERRPAVADLGTLTGLTLGEEVRVPMGGGRFGVRITNLANAPGSTDALDVRWRDAVT